MPQVHVGFRDVTPWIALHSCNGPCRGRTRAGRDFAKYVDRSADASSDAWPNSISPITTGGSNPARRNGGFFDECCHITISRFYRDRGVFDTLLRRVLPDIAARAAREKRQACAWSAGCASGEGPYKGIQFVHQDLQFEAPETRFDLILCRYLVIGTHEHRFRGWCRSIMRRKSFSEPSATRVNRRKPATLLIKVNGPQWRSAVRLIPAGADIKKWRGQQLRQCC